MYLGSISLAITTAVAKRDAYLVEEVEKYGSRSGMGDVFYETIDRVLSLLKH